jgi:cob(I)alamin adenosyltransferase
VTRIYTRTGDDGTTGLVDGSRVSKADARMAAIGDVDEANSAIGVARAALGPGTLTDTLARIQNDLFDLGADLATPIDTPGIVLRLSEGQALWLEQCIDGMTSTLPPLKSFVLPAGSPGASALHLARAIVRRAERSTVIANAEAPVRGEVLVYLNRLSDLLFTAARAMNQDGAGDVVWVPGASR